MDYSKVSIIEESTRYTHVHYIYEGKSKVADNDTLNASALRICQQKLDKRSRLLREKYGFSVEMMPPDEWLWFDASLRELETWGCKIRGKTTYARAFLPKRRNERQPRSLVELGYVKTRYVAYRSEKAVPCPVATGLHQDALDDRWFIIVDDEHGRYVGTDSIAHYAREEGYDHISMQCYYDYDVYNKSVAALDQRQAMKPVQRWNPLEEKGAKPAQETTTTHHVSDAHQEHRQISATSSGDFTSSTDTAESTVCKNQHTLLNENMSSSEISIPQSTDKLSGETVTADLRRAPKTPETILALLSRHLNVPPRPAASNIKAMKRYLQDWEIPAQWLCNATDDVEPSRAWELIERHAVGQLSGPTYYAREISGNKGFTLTARHLVGWDKALLKDKGELRLTGKTWHDVGDELNKVSWWPDVSTPYDGPSIFQDAQSYTGITQGFTIAPPTGSGETLAAPPVEEIPIEPVVPRPPGMSRIVAQHLKAEIWGEYPMLVFANAIIDAADPEMVSVGFETSKDAWFDIDYYSEWFHKSEGLMEALEQATQYALSCQEHEEIAVTVEEVIEPPDSVAEVIVEALPEPEDDVSIEEIEASLRASPPMLTMLPPMAVATPPALQPLLSLAGGKAGMDPYIAEVLMDRVSKARPGCTVQLKPIGGDRVVIALESSPGRWIDIENSMAWAKLSMALPAMNTVMGGSYQCSS